MGRVCKSNNVLLTKRVSQLFGMKSSPTHQINMNLTSGTLNMRTDCLRPGNVVFDGKQSYSIKSPILYVTGYRYYEYSSVMESGIKKQPQILQELNMLKLIPVHPHVLV